LIYQQTWYRPKCLIFAYLKQHLLLAIKGMLIDTFMFQQDSAAAHRAPETVELLSHAMPDILSRSLAIKQCRTQPSRLQSSSHAASVYKMKTDDVQKPLKQTYGSQCSSLMSAHLTLNFVSSSMPILLFFHFSELLKG